MAAFSLISNSQVLGNKFYRLVTSQLLSFYKIDEIRLKAQQRATELLRSAENGEIIFDIREPLIQWAQLDDSMFLRNCWTELLELQERLPALEDAEWEALTEEKKKELFSLVTSSLKGCGSAVAIDVYPSSITRLIDDDSFYLGQVTEPTLKVFTVMHRFAANDRALTPSQIHQYIQFIYILLNKNTTTQNILAFNLLNRIHDRAAALFGPFEAWLQKGRLSHCLGLILGMRAMGFIKIENSPKQIDLSSFNEVLFVVSAVIRVQKGYAGGVIDWPFVFEMLGRVRGVDSGLIEEIRLSLIELRAQVEQMHFCEKALEDQEIEATSRQHELACESLNDALEAIWRVTFTVAASGLNREETYYCRPVEELRSSWNKK